jgi:hypothetical protein
MTVVIVRLYDRYSDAERAVRNLEAAGVPNSDISLVSNNSDNWYDSSRKDRDRDGVDDRAEGAAKGAGIGAALGGAAGLLAGLRSASHSRAGSSRRGGLACLHGAGGCGRAATGGLMAR